MKRIYLKAYTEINLGDDLFVRIICERYPQVQFYIVAPKENAAAFRNIKNLSNIGNPLWRKKGISGIQKILRKLGFKKHFWFDGQVYIGGSIFMQPEDFGQGAEYVCHAHLFRLPEQIPYFILGANFGPFNDERFVALQREFFATQLTDLCFRDKWSYNLFKEISQVRYAPDIVCTYDVPKKKKKNLILISCIYNNGRPGIPSFDNELYVQKMAEICDEYTKMGKEVYLLSMCEFERDEDACGAIKKLCNPLVKTIFYKGDIDEILSFFAQAEYVIASRFHAMVLAWLTKTPVFPICYNNKAEKVIEAYEFLGKFVGIQEFCNAKFEMVDENRKQNYIFDVEEIRREAEHQFEVLDKFLV